MPTLDIFSAGETLHLRSTLDNTKVKQQIHSEKKRKRKKEEGRMHFQI